MVKTRGFTLIELIIVIVILGIVSVGIGQYIRFGAEIYSQGTERDEVVAQARFMLARLAKELRQATPNSIRISCPSGGCATVQCLEFAPFRTSTIYTDNLPSDISSGDTMTVVTPTSAAVQNDQIVVYPLDANDVFDVTQNKRRTIDATPVDLSAETQRWSVNLGFAETSPSQRVYVLANPVSFCIESGQMYRYSGYALNATQQFPTLTHLLDGQRGQMLGRYIQNNLALQPAFSYSSASLTRNALVNLRLNLGFNDNETITLSHEVHVPNVP